MCFYHPTYVRTYIDIIIYICRVSQFYAYQAAIFYADHCEDKVEEFVESQLVKKLEKDWNYKTFITQRDTLVGSSKALLLYP